MQQDTTFIENEWYMHIQGHVRGWVQKFPAWHTKAAPSGKCCRGYISPSLVRFMYQYQYVLK